MGVNNSTVVDIAKTNVPFNWAQFVVILFSAISFTFTLTQIYNRFETVEEDLKNFKIETYEEFVDLREELDFKYSESKRRIDTKTKRNEEAIKRLEENILKIKEK